MVLELHKRVEQQARVLQDPKLRRQRSALLLFPLQRLCASHLAHPDLVQWTRTERGDYRLLFWTGGCPE